ncbi:MAG: hypothetical protein ACM35G_04630 [Planctomycetaceae bacterium]
MSTILKGGPGLRLSLLLIIGIGGLAAAGCQSTPIDLTEGPAPLRTPPPGEAESYEDSLTGGEVFAMYCNQCHNARALGERPFVNYQNVMAHMRVRANFTGKEYAKLIEFLRQWHDIPPSTPPVEPSPKRLVFGQPIAELQEGQAPAQPPRNAAPAPAPPAPEPIPAPPQARLQNAPEPGPLGPQPIPAPSGPPMVAAPG